MKKFLLKFFGIVFGIIFLFAGAVFVLNRIGYGQKIALSLVNNVGTFRFKRLAKMEFKEPLHQAVLKEDLASVKNVLSQYEGDDKKEFINKQLVGLYWPASALRIAYLLGNKEIMEYLIENGADINERDKFGKPILSQHIEIPAPAAVEMILLDSADFFDRVLKFLQLRVPNLFTANLDKSEGNWGKGLFEPWPWEMLTFLVEHGADVNAQDKRGRTSFYLAALHADRKVLEFLAQHGAGINAASDDGTMPIHAAARIPNNLKFFIDQKVDVNVVNDKGMSPLHRAAAGCSLDSIKLLIEHGADVDVADSDGNTPLHLTAKCRPREDIMKKLGYFRIVDFFGADKDRISKAKENWIEVIKLLLKNGADLNRLNKQQLTPIDLDAANYLIENYGKDITAKSIVSLFGHACHEGRVDVVTYFLEKRKKDVSQGDVSLFIKKAQEGEQQVLDRLNRNLKFVETEEDEEAKEYLMQEIKKTKKRYEEIFELLKGLEN